MTHQEEGPHGGTLRTPKLPGAAGGGGRGAGEAQDLKSVSHLGGPSVSALAYLTESSCPPFSHSIYLFGSVEGFDPRPSTC